MKNRIHVVLIALFLIIITPPVQADLCADCPANTVHYWKDPASSTTWDDLANNESSNRLTLTTVVNNASETPNNISNNAASLNCDNNGYATITNSSPFSFDTDPYTMMAWVYIEDFTTTPDKPVILGTYSFIGGNADTGSNLWLNSDTQVYHYEEGGGQSSHALSANTDWPKGEWTHIALTRNSTNVVLYRNGVIDTNVVDSTQADIDTTSNGLFVCRETTRPSGYLFGKVDEILIIRAYRTAEEIAVDLQGYANAADGDTTPPTYSSLSINNSAPRVDDVVEVTVTWADETGLSQYAWYDNSSDSNTSFNLIPSGGVSVLNYTVTQVRGVNVSFKSHANDTSDNWNVSDEVSFNVSNSVLVMAAPTINNSQLRTNDTAECDNGSVTDADLDTISYSFKWFDNLNIIPGQVDGNLSLNLSGLNKDHNITCEITGIDSNGGSVSLNSSPVLILNTPPELSIVGPTDGDHDNNASGLSTYVIVTDIDQDGIVCNLTVNGSMEMFNNSVELGDTSLFNFTPPGDGLYLWNWSCTDKGPLNDTVSFGARQFFYDRVNPNCNWNWPLSDNSIVVNYSILPIDLRCQDTFMNEFEINITDSSGVLLNYNYTTSISGTTINYTINLDISNATEGNLLFKMSASDDHTALKIPDYNPVKKGLRTISYQVPTNNDDLKIFLSDIRVYNQKTDHTKPAKNKEINNLASFITTKTSDDYKYTFEIQFNPTQANKNKYYAIDYLVTSKYYLEYRSFTGFKAHLISNDGNIHTQDNAIDFEGLDNEVLGVKRINDTAFIVTIGTTKTRVKTESVLGLNVIEESANVLVDRVPPQWSDVTSPVDNVYDVGKSYTFLTTWVDTNGISAPSVTVEMQEPESNQTATHTGGGVYSGVIGGFLAVGNYTFRFKATDIHDNINFTSYHEYNVTRATSNVSLTFNGTTENLTVEPGSTVEIIATKNQGEGIIQLLRAGELILSGPGPLGYNYTNSTLGAIQNHTVRYVQTQNYSFSEVMNTLKFSDTIFPYWNPLSVNVSMLRNESLYIDLNATDNIGISEYFINDTVNFIINSATGVLENNSNLSPTNYTLLLSVNDTTNNVNSTLITVFVSEENIIPGITLISPTNNTISNQDLKILFYVNDSNNGASILYCNNTLNGSYINKNSTINLGEQTTLLGNITSDGSYFWNVTCVDNIGLANYSETRIYTFDGTEPSWNQPPENLTLNTSSNLYFDFNATDTHFDEYYINDTSIYSINPSNGILTNSSALIIGFFDILVSANDTAGNVLQDTITLNVSYGGAPANITIIQPTFQYSYVPEGFYLNYSITDVIEIMTVNVSLNYLTNGSLVNTISTAEDINSTSFSELALVNWSSKPITDYFVTINTGNNQSIFQTLNKNYSKTYKLNVTALEAANNNSILNFSVDLVSTLYNQTMSTQNGSMTFAAPSQNYTLTGSSPNFAPSTGTVEVSGADNNHTFFLIVSNSVIITIKDETTNDLILENVSILFSGNETEQTNTTNTGSITVIGLSSGLYSVTFSSNNYSTRTYSITVSNENAVTLNAYLTTSTETVLFTVKDKDNSATLESATMTMSRLINSSWQPVESKQTDITGRAQFTYLQNVNYQFLTTKTSYDSSLFYLNPILFSEYTVKLTKTISLNQSPNLDRITIVFSPSDYTQQESAPFNIIFSSPYGEFSNYGFNITYPGGNYIQTGNNSQGQSLTHNFTPLAGGLTNTINLSYFYTTPTTGYREFYAQFEIIGNRSSNYTTANMGESAEGLGRFTKIFIVVLITIFFAGIFAYLGIPEAGLALGLIMMGYFVKTGFIPLWSVLLSIFAGIIFLISRGGNRG